MKTLPNWFRKWRVRWKMVRKQPQTLQPSNPLLKRLDPGFWHKKLKISKQGSTVKLLFNPARSHQFCNVWFASQWEKLKLEQTNLKDMSMVNHIWNKWKSFLLWSQFDSLGYFEIMQFSFLSWFGNKFEPWKNIVTVFQVYHIFKRHCGKSWPCPRTKLSKLSS